MSGASPVGSPISALSLALDRQRKALIAQDTGTLQSSSEEVLRLLETVRSSGPLDSEQDRDALAKAYIALRANAEMLAKASSASARALAVLFDPAATYGPAGSSTLASPSRRISAA